MSLVNNFEIYSNFWQINPMLKIPEVFAKLYESDKSKDKSTSSKIMWTVAMYCDHDAENKFRDLPEPEKKLLIVKDYLKDKSFKWDSIEHLIKEYESHDSSAIRMMKLWKDIMDKRATFIKKLAEDFDTNAERIDKLLLNNTNLYKEYDRISAALVDEGDAGLVKGGGVESASEEGEI